MAQISDRQLLATPGIGATALGDIRYVVKERPSEEENPFSARMSGAELLKRLTSIEKELQHIRTMLKGRMIEATRNGTA